MRMPPRSTRVFVTRKIPEPGLARLREAGAEPTVFQVDEEAGVTTAEVTDGQTVELEFVVTK